MYARSIKLALFLAFFLAGFAAQAKTINFGTRSAFGLGFMVGAAQNPSTDFVTKPQTEDASFTRIFGIAGFLDFSNFVIRPELMLHYFPLVKGSGTDTTLGQNFRESSDGHTISYGATIQFVPLISQSMRTRGYFSLGYHLGNVKLQTARDYLNAAGGVTNTNTEKFSGNGQRLSAGLGFEFFLVQNYSLQMEGAYQSMKVKEFTYETANNLQGTFVGTGTVARDSAGKAKTLDYSGLYAALSFNLHF